jgi:K+-sensing histidine kinase KdpD
MENLLLLLPSRPQSIVVRYAMTTLIVLVCFGLQIGVERQSGMFTFFLLLPGIFLAAVLFDRGSGFYATILSTALCVAVLLPSDSWLLPGPYLLPFLLFVLVGLALATLSEAMRKALEKAVAAERSAEVMLHELNHSRDGRVRARVAEAFTEGTRGEGCIFLGRGAGACHCKCARSSSSERRRIVDRHARVFDRVLPKPG